MCRRRSAVARCARARARRLLSARMTQPGPALFAAGGSTAPCASDAAAGAADGRAPCGAAMWSPAAAKPVDPMGDLSEMPSFDGDEAAPLPDDAVASPLPAAVAVHAAPTVGSSVVPAALVASTRGSNGRRATGSAAASAAVTAAAAAAVAASAAAARRAQLQALASTSGAAVGVGAAVFAAGAAGAEGRASSSSGLARREDGASGLAPGADRNDSRESLPVEIPMQSNTTVALSAMTAPKPVVAALGAPLTVGAPLPAQGDPFGIVVGVCHSAAAGPSPVEVGQACHKEVKPRRCTPQDPFWRQPVDGGAAASESAPAGAPKPLSMAGLLDPTAGALRCLDVVDAGDREHELEVAEADLTMVHIQSWEQKLDWRSFLSEAVASSKARQLFNAFDVEAEPPKYARPPASRPMPPAFAGAGDGAELFDDVGIGRLVSPDGAAYL